MQGLYKINHIKQSRLRGFKLFRNRDTLKENIKQTEIISQRLGGQFRKCS